jgi:phage terminase small subunit
MSPTLAKLSTRHRLFVLEYLARSGKGAEAAIAASYSVKNASSMASKLLQRPDIKAELELANARRFKRVEVTGDKILAELAHIAFSNIHDYLSFDISGQPYISLADVQRDHWAAIKSFTVSRLREDKRDRVDDEGAKVLYYADIVFHDKQDALDKLARHKNLYDDVKVGGNVTVEIIDNFTTKAAAARTLVPGASDE